MSLSQRQKGDIYWEKRMYYLQASRQKGRDNRRLVNPYVAEEVLYVYKNSDESMLMPLVEGRFDIYPPTAAGHRLFADSIAAIMHMRDILRARLDDTTGSYPDDFIWNRFTEQFREGARILDEVVSTYLKAAGVDEDGQPIDRDDQTDDEADQDQNRNADAAFREKEAVYENTARVRLQKFRANIIKAIAEHEGIDMRTPTDVDTTYEPFEDMVRESGDMAELYQDDIDKLRNIIRAARIRTAELTASRDQLSQMIIEHYLKRYENQMQRQTVLASFLEHRHQIDLMFRENLYAEELCVYYGRYLLHDEPVDPIMYVKISATMGTEAAILGDVLLDTLEGFSIPQETAPETAERTLDYESLVERADEVREYMHAHHGKFDAQCLLSVVTDNEELGRFACDARLLSRDMDRFTASDGAAGLDRIQWMRLLDGWTTAETAYRVVNTLMDFMAAHEESSVSEACAALNAILPDISSFEMAGDIREPLRQLVIERSGLHVER